MTPHDPVPAADLDGLTRGDVVALRVLGTPVPQAGSRAVSTARGVRLITTGGNRLADWRHQVATEAQVAYLHHGTLDGPLGLDISFRFAMPRSRPKWQRALAIVPMTTRPDLDKLVRAVLDSLVSGGLIRDDAQVASLCCRKDEHADGWSGVELHLRRLPQVARTTI